MKLSKVILASLVWAFVSCNNPTEAEVNDESSSSIGMSSIEEIQSSSSMASEESSSSRVSSSSEATFTNSSSRVSSSSESTFTSSSSRVSSSSEATSSSSFDYILFTDDRDEQVYKSITIGTQIWMAENLNYATDKGSKCYDDSNTNCEQLGRLYTWNRMMEADSLSGSDRSQVQGVCPVGWHVSSDYEWRVLEEYVLGENPHLEIGEILKANDESWKLNTGLDIYGFSALPAGVYDISSFKFKSISDKTTWWTTRQMGSIWYKAKEMIYYLNTLEDYSVIPNSYYSVRCVKDPNPSSQASM